MRNLARILIFIMFFHTNVWAGPKEFQLLKTYQMIVSSYNDDPIKFLKDHKTKILRLFDRKEDKKFFEQQMKIIKNTKISLKLKLENNKFHFIGNQTQLELNIENLDEFKFFVNGKSWQLNKKFSLEDNYKILSDIITNTKKTSWIPSVISNAYALGFVVKAILVLLVLLVGTFFINELLMAKFLKKLKELEKLCDATEEQGQEQAEKFFKLHEFFREDIDQELIAKANITNCTDFVEELAKNDDYPYNREESEQICKVSQNIEHCFDTFKLQRAQYNSGRESSSKENTLGEGGNKESLPYEALPNN